MKVRLYPFNSILAPVLKPQSSTRTLWECIRWIGPLGYSWPRQLANCQFNKVSDFGGGKTISDEIIQDNTARAWKLIDTLVKTKNKKYLTVELCIEIILCLVEGHLLIIFVIWGKRRYYKAHDAKIKSCTAEPTKKITNLYFYYYGVKV